MSHATRRCPSIAAAGLALLVVACGGERATKPAGAGSGAAPAPTLAADRWRADLAVLGRELPARHVEPFFQLPEATFRAELAAIDAAAATLADDQVAVRLAQLVASLGDGHTRLAIPAPLAYPLRLYDFDDGLFVIGAPPDALWAVGGEVVAIGDRPAAEAMALASTVVPHDNDSQRRGEAALALLAPVIARGLGLATAGGALRLTLRIAGEPRPLEVTASALRPSAPRQPLPLARRAPQQTYWSEYLPDRRALFVQYNACREATPPFADFVASLAKTLDAQQVDRVVIDLRQNGGGNSEVFRPFLTLLAARPALAGRVFVLIGRHTFSSAVLNALALEDAGATLVGEVAGGAPSHHGEVKTFALPDHGYTIQYSTKFFAHPRHPGRALRPALAVPLLAADWFAGRDAALEAALAAPTGGAAKPR